MTAPWIARPTTLLKLVIRLSCCRNGKLRVLLWWACLRPALFLRSVNTCKSVMVSAEPFSDRSRPMPYSNHKWGLDKSPTCDCGHQQTMSRIVDACPLTKFDGGLQQFTRSWRWRSQVAGIYSDYSIREMKWNCFLYDVRLYPRFIASSSSSSSSSNRTAASSVSHHPVRISRQQSTADKQTVEQPLQNQQWRLLIYLPATEPAEAIRESPEQIAMCISSA